LPSIPKESNMWTPSGDEVSTLQGFVNLAAWGRKIRINLLVFLKGIGVRFSANLANLPEEDYRDSAPPLNMIRNQLGIKARR
jgi:hypothetical protein